MALEAKRPTAPGFRIRTITAGAPVDLSADFSTLTGTIDFLDRARGLFTDAGFEVQTIRLATQELSAQIVDQGWSRSLELLQQLDALMVERDILLSIGPLVADPEFAFSRWAAELASTTQQLIFSVRVSDPTKGPVTGATRVAAETILALAAIGGDGEQNFRFAAAANIPAGTPFFPVAYHRGPPAFSLGLESAPLVTEAFRSAAGFAEATDSLRGLLTTRLKPVVGLAHDLAAREGIDFGGLDLSPAPGLDASIGEGLEGLTGVPFGAPSTLAGCAAVTAALSSTDLPSCGYSGLMLPVLEDPVLARRAQEGRFDLKDLLLYSSVCGTGLDVVPLPGDCSVEVVTRIIEDVSAMATKLRKPLSARLLPIPGKRVGELATFDNPHLIDSAIVMSAQ